VLLSVTGTTAVIAYKRLGRARVFDVQSMRLTRVTQNGKVRQMAISPDGQYVAYALREGLTQSLWLREVRSANEFQLLPPETVNFPALEFSSDGSFVYFSRSEKTNPLFSHLCRVRTTESSVEQLIRDASSSVSFSPDGKRFVYTRGYSTWDVVTEGRIADAGRHGRSFAGFDFWTSGL
jgi:Tol biopolymer transport system component